jgi:hypothetical protein
MENLKRFNVYATDKAGMVQKFEFEHSYHSMERASQRGINNDRLSLALAYGEIIQKQGLEFHILGENRIPDEFEKEKEKLKNTIVVTRRDCVITCYRAKDPYKQIRKKSKIFYTQREAA